MNITIAFGKDGGGKVMNMIVNDLLMIPLGRASLAHVNLGIIGV